MNDFFEDLISQGHSLFTGESLLENAASDNEIIKWIQNYGIHVGRVLSENNQQLNAMDVFNEVSEYI